ncbi:hypothetical protein BC941DRAFT_437126 [Chlamydoabsidia padenii]|nr:hypothetical protein BC941DRAFT_437126 [Chlamydoabsidia padenii]
MSNPSSTAAHSATPRLVLRSYKPSDFEQVDFIFYSTYFALVPEGVKQKLRSPLFWIIWIGVYGYLLAIVPVLLADMSVPSWSGRLLQIFMTVSWGLVSFAAVFVMTDRLDVVNHIEKARQNDLRDPEVCYMNLIKEERIVSDDDSLQQEQGTAVESPIKRNKTPKKRVTFDKDTKPATEVVRIAKPKDQQTQSHFWVLQMDGQVCGTIGLAQYDRIQYDQRPPLAPGWMKMGQAICGRYGLNVPSFLQFDPVAHQHDTIFAQAHAPLTATLQRLAVKQEFQGCGLASILITRALTWAHQQGITQVFAVTNEMQGLAANILSTHHQFSKVKTERKGWLGQCETTWVCHVQQWHEQHASESDNLFKDTTNNTASTTD